MEWNSPWGIGFPGWHTECVAMAVKYLGIPFDIHTGAVDLIPTHHTNEIAQAEAVFKKELAKFWLHGEHLLLKEGKMAKSEGNIILIDDLVKKGFNPLSYRYLCLTTHYRSKLNFSFEALKASQNALENLYDKFSGIKNKELKIKNTSYKKEFLNYINDDLNTPKALALMWKLIKENKASSGLLLDFDKVFGLGLAKVKKDIIPKEIKNLAELREKYRKEKDFKKADKIRKEIESKGYIIKDTLQGPVVK
jgi:cysteinyl-tRNA synthetase